jgi:hypothetical protein
VNILPSQTKLLALTRAGIDGSVDLRQPLLPIGWETLRAFKNQLANTPLFLYREEAHTSVGVSCAQDSLRRIVREQLRLLALPER